MGHHVVRSFSSLRFAQKCVQLTESVPLSLTFSSTEIYPRKTSCMESIRAISRDKTRPRQCSHKSHDTVRQPHTALSCHKYSCHTVWFKCKQCAFYSSSRGLAPSGVVQHASHPVDYMLQLWWGQRARLLRHLHGSNGRQRYHRRTVFGMRKR